MWNITSPSDLYAFTYEQDFNIDPAAHEVMHFMQNLFNNFDWTLCMLHMLGADRMIYAKKSNAGIRLRSGRAFSRRYKARINVLLPHEAFNNMNDGTPLEFVWRD